MTKKIGKWKKDNVFGEWKWTLTDLDHMETFVLEIQKTNPNRYAIIIKKWDESDEDAAYPEDWETIDVASTRRHAQAIAKAYMMENRLGPGF